MKSKCTGTAFIFGEMICPDDSEMSLPEKMMMLRIQGEQDELPYPLHELKVARSGIEREYEIPEGDREAVLKRLCFIRPMPSMDDELLDLQEDKAFKVRDFRVIRWRGTNLLVSPYYPKSGGTLLDWAKPDHGGVIANVVRLQNTEDSNGEEN